MKNTIESRASQGFSISPPTPSISPRVVPTHVTKGLPNGKEVTIPLEMIGERLDALKPYSKTAVKDLPASAAKNFSVVQDYVKNFHDIPDEYEKIYSMFSEKYTSRSDLIPGTVEAYFVGCSTQDKSIDPRGCSIVCAQGAPLPRQVGAEDATCSVPVLKYRRTDKSSTFDLLNTKTATDMDKSNVIIYADKGFAGFSQVEVNTLKDFGVKTMVLLEYDSVDNTYGMAKTVELQNYGPSDADAPVKYLKSDNTYGNGGFAIIIIIILVVIMIVIYNNRKKM